MSEYWKSNPRKFCDFCKCWIADNRPSIEFHERGKRHNENVQKRLEEIGKKGKEDYENKLKENDYMKEMEEAALKAYQKDIEQNPDFTGVKIAKIAEASNAKIVVSDKTEEKPQKKKPEKKKPEKKNPLHNPESKWQEAKTPEGFSYYWNAETGESAWEVPKEGFVSLQTEEKCKKETPTKATKSSTKKKKSDHSKKKEAKTQAKKSDVSSKPVYGPLPSTNPYGNWESTFQPVNEVDLQLPALPDAEYYVPEVVTKRPEVKFEEKVVTLSKEVSAGPISFKKRKGGDDQKKNVRRRIDD